MFKTGDLVVVAPQETNGGNGIVLPANLVGQVGIGFRCTIDGDLISADSDNSAIWHFVMSDAVGIVLGFLSCERLIVLFDNVIVRVWAAAIDKLS